MVQNSTDHLVQLSAGPLVLWFSLGGSVVCGSFVLGSAVYGSVILGSAVCGSLVRSSVVRSPIKSIKKIQIIFAPKA